MYVRVSVAVGMAGRSGARGCLPGNGMRSGDNRLRGARSVPLRLARGFVLLQLLLLARSGRGAARGLDDLLLEFTVILRRLRDHGALSVDRTWMEMWARASARGVRPGAAPPGRRLFSCAAAERVRRVVAAPAHREDELLRPGVRVVFLEVELLAEGTDAELEELV